MSTASRQTGFSCPLCDAAGFTLLETQADWLSRAAGTADERRQIGGIVAADPDLAFGGIVRCRECGLATVRTRPSPDALGRFYSAYYASASYGTKRDKKIKRAARRVRRLSRRIRSNGSNAKRRFLDVGANLGYAVEGARQRGFDATGIEIDAEAVARATAEFPGNSYHATTVEAFAARGETFDLVYCSEVIEHAIDIRSFASALMDLVAPGGVLFVTTPADGHRATPDPLVGWVQVKPPEHLHWFAKAHLLRLFDRPDFAPRFRFNPKPGHKLVLRRALH
ncbi:methyltransferase domain-containing protein [uncultured Algimonas sp.]|uniref:class I SAM-dependent methyltransferase n=1 Tax=uncultured Algimonas sp. TaxID=1547920 RepID=UPI002618CEC4|nr:methyltransferase domain-containing protein [uncultured Algimonas sp.]